MSKHRAEAGSSQRFEQEHLSIRGLAEQISRAGDLKHALLGIERLLPLLRQHFAAEEAPGGLFENIRTTAPQHDACLRDLVAEHQLLAAGLGDWVRRADACLAGPVAELLGGAEQLMQRLLDHEARECELLIDNVNTDLGTND